MEVLMTLYMIALMYRNTKVSCVELADCFDGLSHDRLSRMLEQPRCWPTLLWRRGAVRLIGQGGYLMLDDTVLEKWGAAIFGVYWVYSSRLGKVVQGINVVLLVWSDGKRRVPIGIKLWRKGGPSKVVLAGKLLRWAHRLDLHPQYVLFDSWYSAKVLLQQIQSYGWHFVTRLRKNRKFNGQALSQQWSHCYGHGVGQLTGGLTVLVVKDGSHFWASSDVSLTVPEVKAIYRLKQQIEETFKILKDQLRWGKCPASSKAAQLAHLHLCLIAFCALQSEAVRQGTTVYRLRRCLFRQAIPLQSPLLQPLSVTA